MEEQAVSAVRMRIKDENAKFGETYIIHSFNS
jgi:hypothetical protein